jgi:5-methylcytosine-specific restriction enzyme subunit McrC
MITLFEHFEYGVGNGFIDDLSDDKIEKLKSEEKYHKTFQRHNKDASCYYIEKRGEEKYHFSTSYFVGVDWIIENQLSIYVQPKQNNETTEIDCLTMLFEALKEPQNVEHLDGLCEIYFDKPQISITQKQDLLTPFLIVQFLQTLKRIVQKGLKKTYYPVVKNLESKVKGKILINQTIKTNLVKNQITKTVCRYDEFGFNGEENKILKKALLFSQHAIQSFNSIEKYAFVNDLVNYICPTFEEVSDDIQTDKIKVFKPNPMYREYEQALKLALLILKRFSYNITETEKSEKLTPPFWIDMSKLFELYVFKRLREIFPKQNEVFYHEKMHYQELDFLIKSEDREYLMVVDAKYKPRYENKSIDKEDIRQVCGYARLEKVYEKLGIAHDRNIDCLIVYSYRDKDSSKEILNQEQIRQDKESGYVNFYKLGISLPSLA